MATLSLRALPVTLWVLMLVASVPGWAGGVRALGLKTITPADGAIIIDGALADWPAGEAVKYDPVILDSFFVQADVNTQVKFLRQQPHAVAVRLCYDKDALYAALRWQGSISPKQLGSVTFHFAQETPAHLTFTWPGKSATAGATSVYTSAADKRGGTQEIRIPWSTIGKDLPKPGSALTWAADFVWPDLTSSLLRELPYEMRRQSISLSNAFLTSKEKLFALTGYLPNPADWGTLRFTEAVEPTETQRALMMTGATVAVAARALKTPTVDGTLDEWPAASFLSAVYAPGFIGDRYSCSLATMYDAQNIYIAARFTSPAYPPLNSMAEKTQAGYNGGDCLQIRLSDGVRALNLCGWFDTAAAKPALTADGIDLKNPFLLTQGAQEAFRPVPGGYVQEIAIPWRVLTGKAAPQVGDMWWRAQHPNSAPDTVDAWKLTFQPWWAGLDPQFTAYATSEMQVPGALALHYTVPFEGNVSLGIFATDGTLLRWLLRDEHRRAGANVESWDGLDQLGKPIPAGGYSWKAIVHPPIGLEYQMTLGNPGTPPWPTTDGKGDWIGDESSVQGVATDGQWVFLASPCSEKGFAMIAVDEKGQRQWGTTCSFNPRCVSLAVRGDYLYALYSGPEKTGEGRRYPGSEVIERAVLACFDKRTGQPALFSKTSPNLRIATWPYRHDVHYLWDLRAKNAFSPEVYGGQPRYFSGDVGETTSALGIAVTADRVYVSLFYENKLLVLDATTAKLVDEIPLAKPVSLTALRDGTLLAVSGTSVVSVNPATKAVTPLISNGLVAPFGVNTDRQGNIYVSDWGTSFQVKVFSPAGKQLRTVGKPGGRSWKGAWIADSMLLPRGLAVTDQGDLWVAEDDNLPSRVSVWNTQTGAFKRDYLGPAGYGGNPPFWRDPQDASLVYTQGVFWRVDEGKKTAVPVATPLRRFDRNQPTANAYFGAPVCQSFLRNGKQFLALSGGPSAMNIYFRDGLTLTPVATVGNLGEYDAGDGTQIYIWDSDIGIHDYTSWNPEFYKGHRSDNYSWSDLNGDGLQQTEEMHWVVTGGGWAPYQEDKMGAWNNYWGATVGPDGALYFGTNARGHMSIFRLDPTWSPQGMPVYDLTTAKRIVLLNNEAISGLYVNAENKLFVSSGSDGGARAGVNALSCYDRDGKFLWGMPRPQEQGPKDIKADGVVGDLNIPGLGHVLGTWSWHGNYRPYLVTSDGLYVTSLLDDTRLGPTACWDESFRYYYQAPDGTPYLINGANDAFHLLRITGLEQTKRISGVLTLSAEDVQRAADIRATPVKLDAPKPIIHMGWLDNVPTLDGDLSEWSNVPATTVTGNKDRVARVSLARDADTLYLAYAVQGSTLVNKGNNWQTLFTTGDCVDLMLAAGANAQKAHYTPAEGDLRLLFSVYQDQPIAVLYQPVVPSTTTPTLLMAARIDQVVRLTGARVTVKRGANSYTLEAAVPLRDLGLDPTATDTLKGDVGVVYADATGRNRELRSYYYNKHTEMTADLTTEATLQPGEWGPVEFPLGRNMLNNGGFEGPLTKDHALGWMVNDQSNGATAQLVTVAPYSGNATLLLQQTTPVTFPAAAYTLPDYGDFLKAANAGKGGGFANVSQTVAVTGGKSYRFRVHVRALDLMNEKKDPGANRGYCAFMCWVYWAGAPDQPTPKPGAVWVINLQQDTTGWMSLLDAQANNFSVAVPYTAPADAVQAHIAFMLVANGAGHQPKVYVDDAEFVEAPTK